jgi:hypothetical protein
MRNLYGLIYNLRDKFCVYEKMDFF